MSEHSAEKDTPYGDYVDPQRKQPSMEHGPLRRLSQIEDAAERITPAGPGNWGVAEGVPTAADMVMISPADYVWLVERARATGLDDALCDALAAARHGEYDGMTVEEHLEHLIQRVRIQPEEEQS